MDFFCIPLYLGLFYRIVEAKVQFGNRKKKKKEYKIKINKSIFISLYFTTSTYKFNTPKKMHQLQYTFYRGDNKRSEVQKSLTDCNGLWSSTAEPYLTKPYSLVFSSSHWLSGHHRSSTDLGDTANTSVL